MQMQRIVNEEEEQQGFENEAREKEKCFIILGDQLFLSGATEPIRGMQSRMQCPVWRNGGKGRAVNKNTAPAWMVFVIL